MAKMMPGPSGDGLVMLAAAGLLLVFLTRKTAAAAKPAASNAPSGRVTGIASTGAYDNPVNVAERLARLVTAGLTGRIPDAPKVDTWAYQATQANAAATADGSSVFNAQLWNGGQLDPSIGYGKVPSITGLDTTGQVDSVVGAPVYDITADWPRDWYGV